MPNDLVLKGRLSEEGLGVWTTEEHERFIHAMELYPKGPWKVVAEFVGTRNARQTMTHAQKYRQKLERHQRGLRTKSKSTRADVTARHPRSIISSAVVRADVTPVSPRRSSYIQTQQVAPTKSWLRDPLPPYYYPDMLTRLPLVADGPDMNAAMLPLIDFEPRVASPVDSHAVWFDDCFDHLLDSFDDNYVVEV